MWKWTRILTEWETWKWQHSKIEKCKLLLFKRIEEDLKLLSHTNAAFKVFALTFQYLRSPTINKSHKLRRRNVTSLQIRVFSLSDFNHVENRWIVCSSSNNVWHSPSPRRSVTNLFLGPLFRGSAWLTRILRPAIRTPSAPVQASWHKETISFLPT